MVTDKPLPEEENIYKYGDKILVNDVEAKEWEERIFIAFNKSKEAMCVLDHSEIDFEEGNPFEIVAWKFHKPLSDEVTSTYNPEEMIGRTVKDIATGSFHIITSTRKEEFIIMSSEYTWEDFNEYFQLVN
jgi:hypothetical protein